MVKLPLVDLAYAHVFALLSQLSSRSIEVGGSIKHIFLVKFLLGVVQMDLVLLCRVNLYIPLFNLPQINAFFGVRPYSLLDVSTLFPISPVFC